jgi:UDP-N-acetylglucosamine acyltransferase
VNRIHDSAVIGPGVNLGDDNVIGPNVVILGPTTIGDGNWIGPGVVIGTPAEIRGAPHPQPWDAAGDHGGTTIGDNNVLREHTCIHAPHFGTTTLGSDCYVMNNCYIGHDGHIGDGVTMASTVVMGGHCIVADHANLGLSAALHQRSVVGTAAMVGMGSVVVEPVPPYAKAFGNPCRVVGANAIGMERLGIAPAAIEELAAAYTTARRPGDPLPPAPPGLEVAFSGFPDLLRRAAR